MRRIRLTVLPGRLDEAYDTLLPRLQGGLHVSTIEDEVQLIALGEEGELPPVDEVRNWIAHLADGPVVEEDAGPDLADALAAVLPPHQIGGRIVLRDALHPPAPTGWIDVELERGAGFGTGAHPTTRHCLELLLTVEPEGAFADLGCGAGALTIAAAKLGFEPVVGVDLIHEATTTAARNAANNGVEVDFVAADLRTLTGLDVETAVVNVSETDVHEHLAATLSTGLRTLIVSGLDDADQLANALGSYADMGLRESNRIGALRWPAVLLHR